VDKYLDYIMIMSFVLATIFCFLFVNERLMFFFLFLWEGILIVIGNNWYLKKIKKLLQRRVRLIKRRLKTNA
jgi:predicted membrane channel-forming protein YqfA (hemolysin III family)